jgi:CO/xanthine dehydrogenase Mo-binding subunit
MHVGSAHYLSPMVSAKGSNQVGMLRRAVGFGYHVPVHLDVPEIDVIWTDIADPYSPMGVHGIGEIGITGVGAAIANAVNNATGKRIRDLPITLDKLIRM